MNQSTSRSTSVTFKGDAEAPTTPRGAYIDPPGRSTSPNGTRLLDSKVSSPVGGDRPRRSLTKERLPLVVAVEDQHFARSIADAVRDAVTRREQYLGQRHTEELRGLRAELRRLREDFLQGGDKPTDLQTAPSTSTLPPLPGTKGEDGSTASTDIAGVISPKGSKDVHLQLNPPGAAVSWDTPAGPDGAQPTRPKGDWGHDPDEEEHDYGMVPEDSMEDRPRGDADASPMTPRSSRITTGLQKQVELDECWAAWAMDAVVSEDMVVGTASNASKGTPKQTLSRLVTSLSEQRFVSASLIGRNVQHPNSGKKIWWDLLAILFILYDTVTVPLQAFDIPENTIMNTVIWASLLYWTLDIPFSFCVGYYRRGVLELRPKKIATHYCATWLTFDICVVALDWVVAISSTSEDGDSAASRVGRTLKSSARVVRSLRLLRLLKVKHFVHALQSNINSEYVHIFIRVVKLVIIIALVNHVIACGWYAVGNQDDGWVTTGTLKSFDTASVGYKYTTSLHWSLTQFTPASMEVFPTNTAERTFAVLTLLFALVVFSSFVSSITSAMSSLRKLGSGHRKEFMALRLYLQANSVPNMLSIRIMKHLQYVVAKRRWELQAKDVELLQLLSKPLQMELQEQITLPKLTVHKLFLQYSKISVAAMRQLCSSACTQIVSSPGDVVAMPGEVAKAMFFVAKGLVAYTHVLNLRRESDNKEGNTSVFLKEKAWLSEMTLWTSRWVYRGEISAPTHSELVALDRDRFREVTIAHPRAMTFVCRYAEEFVIRLQEEQNVAPLSDMFDASYVLDMERTPSMDGEVQGPVTSLFTVFHLASLKQSTTNSAQRLVRLGSVLKAES